MKLKIYFKISMIFSLIAVILNILCLILGTSSWVRTANILAIISCSLGFIQGLYWYKHKK